MRHCFICGSNEKETFYNATVVVPSPYPLLGSQSIVQCVACGFVYGDSDNTLPNFENYYTTLNKHKKRASDASELDCAYFLKIAQYFNKLDRSAKILDFGSGDLLMKKTLLKMGFIDIQTYDIDGDEPTDKFDFIVSTHTFEHILNADAVIRKLEGMLASEGLLLIAVPDIHGYESDYCGPYNSFDLEHINHFSLASLKNLFITNNLSIKEGSEGRREVRPNLFYPEVIVIGEKKHPIGKVHLENDIEQAKESLNSYIELSEKDFLKGLETLKSYQHKNRIMWGIGIQMMRVAFHSEVRDVKFVDSDSRLWGKHINGCVIEDPDAIKEIDVDNDVFFVAAVNSGGIESAIREKFGLDIEIVVL